MIKIFLIKFNPKMKNKNILSVVILSVISNIVPLVGILFYNWDLALFATYSLIAFFLIIFLEIIEASIRPGEEANLVAIYFFVFLGIPMIWGSFYFLESVIGHGVVLEALKKMLNPSPILSVKIPVLLFLLLPMMIGHVASIIRISKIKGVSSGAFLKFPKLYLAIIYRTAVLVLAALMFFYNVNFLIILFLLIILMFPVKMFLRLILKFSILLVLLYISKINSSSDIFLLLYVLFSTLDDIWCGLRSIEKKVVVS